MDEKENHNKTGIMNGNRSSDEIRRDIEREKDNFSHTVEQIGERIKEKMDWREYVNNYPFLSLGAATGIGYLSSSVFRKRTSSIEQIMRPIAKEARKSLGGLRPESNSPGLARLILVGIVTKVATALIKDAASSQRASGTGPHYRAELDTAENPRVDRDIHNEKRNYSP